MPGFGDIGCRDVGLLLKVTELDCTLGCKQFHVGTVFFLPYYTRQPNDSADGSLHLLMEAMPMTAHETLWRSAESLLEAPCGPPLALAVPGSASSSRYLVAAYDLVLLRVGTAEVLSLDLDFSYCCSVFLPLRLHLVPHHFSRCDIQSRGGYLSDQYS